MFDGMKLSWKVGFDDGELIGCVEGCTVGSELGCTISHVTSHG